MPFVPNHLVAKKEINSPPSTQRSPKFLNLIFFSVRGVSAKKALR